MVVEHAGATTNVKTTNITTHCIFTLLLHDLNNTMNNISTGNAQQATNKRQDTRSTQQETANNKHPGPGGARDTFTIIVLLV